MKKIDKMDKKELLEALCSPHLLNNLEEHIEAFKRFKNLRANK